MKAEVKCAADMACYVTSLDTPHYAQNLFFKKNTINCIDLTLVA